MENTAQPIPTVDLKAPLKIEEQHADLEPKVNYGEKLFFAGIIFCVIILLCVGLVSFFWLQNANQTQKVATIQQK